MLYSPLDKGRYSMSLMTLVSACSLFKKIGRSRVALRKLAIIAMQLLLYH